MGNMFFLISDRYIHVTYVLVYLNDNANIVITIYCRYYYIITAIITILFSLIAVIVFTKISALDIYIYICQDINNINALK